MKILSYRTLSLFVSLLLCFGPLNAQAEVKELGDVCFSLDNGTLAPPLGGRLGVLLYGAGHIVLDGQLGNAPLHGTAVIDGNNFVVTLNTSYVSNDKSVSSFSVIHMVVDAGTLQGTYTTMFTQTSPPPATSGVAFCSLTCRVNFYRCN
jgi:hypothetical protein